MKIQQNNKRAGLKYWLMADNRLLIAILTINMCAEAHAQRPEPSGPVPLGIHIDSIKPLQIGDTIPEALLNLPLQVVNHPEGKETITLADYKGKLIILDFWAT
ncbi:hypothetical protein [Parapedobacter tibetensis]|uniref:hypothetical protein n=1 Tax=Parapedobacter tibetensis TaxID=2972951 RepID=UPI00214DDD99|nr:hypothetical protein [Parapedobacter tibetensis]